MGKENKHYELECLNVLFDKNVVKGTFAQQMHKLLLNEEDNFREFEKPDFILECEDGSVVGVEHCLVDVLFTNKHKKAQSMVRMQDGEIHRKIDEYNNNPEKKAREIEDGTAMRWTIDSVNKRFKRREEFDYSAFIKNFRKVCSEHNSKCSSYRENLRQYIGVSLGCLIEIPCAGDIDGYTVVDQNMKSRNQFLIGIPFTYDMVKVLENMTGFDFIIVCMYESLNPKRKAKRKIYYFTPKNIMEGIKQQEIRLFRSFDFTKKYKIIGRPIERKDGNYEITHEVKTK